MVYTYNNRVDNKPLKLRYAKMRINTNIIFKIQPFQ